MAREAGVGEFPIPAVFRYSVEFVMSRRFAPRRGVSFLSGAGASGSDHLPWALPRIVPRLARSRNVANGGECAAGREHACVC